MIHVTLVLQKKCIVKVIILLEIKTTTSHTTHVAFKQVSQYEFGDSSCPCRDEIPLAL